MTTPVNSEHFTARMGRPWAQPDGPNTPCYPLNCHDVGDIDEPGGDITTALCPDPANTTDWYTILRAQGAPGEPTTTITTPVGKTSDWLERQHGCAMPVYINLRHCGRSDVFLNYDRYFTLAATLFTSKGLTNLVSREGADLTEQTFALSAAPIIARIFPLVATRQSTASTVALNDLAFCNQPRCQGPCGVALDPCQTGYAVGDPVAVATADVLETLDGGAGGWAATATDPFAADEIISTVVCFDIDRDTTRILVGRGTADAGAGVAEVAYSDDGGDTWTLVTLGAASEYFPWNGSLFALDHRHIWGGLDSGDIYFSDDSGATWTEQVTTNAGVNDITAIKFIDENHGLFVGHSNTVYYTEDGGEHWANIGGPAAKAGVNVLACDIRDAYRWYIGYADGDLYYTMDGGTNWTQRTGWSHEGVTNSVNDIHFINEYHGAFCGDFTDGSYHRAAIWRTWNGGEDWELQYATDDDLVAGGFNAVWMCHINLIFAVGEVMRTDTTPAIYVFAGGGGAY